MDLSGQKLGKYELLKKLGAGGMADVYQARQPLIERLVAIKVMQPHLAGTASFAERFQREAQRLGQLRHPNIVSVLDFDIVNGIQFLVMDFISGPTLQQHLQENGPLSLTETLALAAQILDALQYAHERGVVHCDLKPANVMFLDHSRRQVVLTDFGIARMMDASGQAQTSTMIGTPAYMAPEMLQSQPFDGRSDLYSLGVMLYEMVTGQQPFSGENPVSVILKHLQEAPPDLRLKRPELPAGFVRLVERALAKAPAERFQSAAEMRQEVNALQQQLSQSNLAAAATRPVITAPFEGAAPTISASPSSQGIPDAARPTGMPPTPPTQRADAAYPASPAAPQPTKRLPILLALGVGLFLLLSFLGGGAFLAARLMSARSQAQTSPTVTLEAPTATAIALQPTATEAIGEALPTPIAEIPPIESNRYGGLSLMLDAQGNPGLFLALLETLPQLPAGSQYMLWAGSEGNFQQLGSFTLSGGQARLQQPISAETIERFGNLLVSVESEGSNAVAPSGSIILQGGFSAEQRAALQEIAQRSQTETGTAYLVGALNQALIALSHQTFAIEAAQSGDGIMARAHSEHVINILEGKTGEHFGDRDGNGRPENPGDNVGVLRYLEGLEQQLKALAAAAPQVGWRQAQVQAVLPRLQAARTAIQEVVQLNVQMLETSDPQQQLAQTEQSLTRLQILIYGTADNPVGLWQTAQLALQAAEISLSSPEPLTTAPLLDPQTPPVASLWQDLRGNLAISLLHLPQPPEGFHYVVWAQRGDTGKFESVIELTGGQSEATIRFNRDLFNGYTQITLSQEAEGPLPEAPTVILAQAPLRAAAGGLIGALSAFNNSGPLDLAQGQAEMAAEHMTYLLQSLAKKDLATAKRHAEHIVNILEGKNGPHFGDVNGDNNPQNPGDGVGVLGYLAQIEERTDGAQAEAQNDPVLQRELKQLLAAVQGTRALITGKLFEAASKVIASDTVEEAQANAQVLQALVQAVQLGLDADGNEVVDPYAGEGGLLAVKELALALRRVVLR